MLPGTLATVAYLAEIRPLIPPAERAWTIVADLEVQALLSAGDLPAATRQLQAIHQQVEARAAADPANTEWQRDLSVSHEQARGCGGGGRGPGRRPHRLPGQPGHRRAAGRRRPRQHRLAARPVGQPQQAGGCGGGGRGPGRRPHRLPGQPDIAVRLAAADPANTEWQRDLSVSHDKLGDVAVAAGDLAAARAAYQASLDIAVRLAAADPANTGWQRDLSVSHEQAGGCGGGGRGPGRRPRRLPGQPGHRVRLAAADPANTDGSATCRSATTSWGTWRWRPGTWPPPAPPTRPAWTSAMRLAAADPANTGWQRDLSVSHDKLGDVAVAAGDLAAARTAYQASLDIRRAAGRRRPRQHRMAARPVGQPRTSSGTWRWRPGTWPPPATAYQASLDIRVRLAAADPANTGWQRDLSVSHEQARGCGGGGRGPGRRPRRLPGQPRHRARGWPPPTPPTPAGSATCRSATTSWGTWRWRPGTWPPPAPPTRPAWTSPCGWPPPTPPTPNGSATCRSATTSWGTWRWRPGTWPPPAPPTRPASTSAARLAAADPANTGWQRDLSVSHEQARGCGGGGRGPGRRPRRLPGQPGHRRAAGRRRPRQHPMAARPAARASAH